MPGKDGKHKPTPDELLAQFDDLSVESNKIRPPPATTTAGTTGQGDGVDALDELQNLASKRASSRSTSPRISSSSTGQQTPVVVTPDRSSEEKQSSKRSTEGSRPYHTGITATELAESSTGRNDEGASNEGGGWWGGIFATASAAVKQAEAAVNEIRKNEDAQKWASQVRGNVGALRELGGGLRTLAMPTFTSLIHTIAPPISSHERLQLHITHDLRGYPALDPLVYAVFSRVMSQVEGGDLLVVQRGQEAAPKRGGGNAGGTPASTAGWSDGPWWRYNFPGQPRSISAVKGAVEASKLARASTEAYATEYFAARGGIEEAMRQASENLSQSNPVRSSDIFLGIQALIQSASEDLFLAGPSGDSTQSPAEAAMQEAKPVAEEEVAFAMYLHDPIHGISFHTVSQSVPKIWIDWLDASAGDAGGDSSDENVTFSAIPEAIAEIIESGGVDPREWVSEWVEDTLTLGVGIVAQRYIARRMGVGSGGVNKGKMKAEQATAIESGAGEVARAI